MGKPSTDRAAIGHIIDGLTQAGWKLDRVDDGGYIHAAETMGDALTKSEALTAITDVDNAHLFVTRGEEEGWVWFVQGNDPEEVAADHTLNLSDAIDPIVKPWWE